MLDEFALAGKYAVHRVDHTCREVWDPNLPFGGKSVLFFGDLNQLTPVNDPVLYTDPSTNTEIDKNHPKYHR